MASAELEGFRHGMDDTRLHAIVELALRMLGTPRHPEAPSSYNPGPAELSDMWVDFHAGGVPTTDFRHVDSLASDFHARGITPTATGPHTLAS